MRFVEEAEPRYWTAPDLRATRCVDEASRQSPLFTGPLATGLTDTPWVVIELAAVTDQPAAVVKSLRHMTAASRLWVPSAPDPDLPALPGRPVPFVVGPTADTPLIAGRTSEAFLAAWRATRTAILEVHLWLTRPGETPAVTFFLCLLSEGGVLKLFDRTGPMLAPDDPESGYRCRWGRTYGPAPEETRDDRPEPVPPRPGPAEGPEGV